MTTPEFVAAILGTLPDTSVGLLMTVPPPAAGVAKEACVAIEEVEFDRVGEDGLPEATEGIAGGDGATELESVRWCWLPGNGDGGSIVGAGVGSEEFCDDDDDAVCGMVGCLAVGTSPVYT